MSSRRPAAPPRARRGFTIVELLIAIIVLSVGMLGMASLVGSSTRLQRLAQSRGEATALAEAKLEELRAFGATDSTDALRANLAIGGSITSGVAGYADSLTGTEGVMWYRRWAIANGIAGARRATIRVYPRTRPNGYVARLDVTSTILLQ